MGRKRKIAIALGKNPDSLDANLQPVEDLKPAPRRISIPLNDDGSVALGSMRDDQIADFKTLIHRPEIVEEVTPKPAAEFISPTSCDGVFDVFGKVMSFTAVKFKDVPADIAEQAFPFTAAEKEMLREPTARVINKHAPAWLVKWQDEIALSLILVTVINAKIQLCNALLAARTPQVVPAPVTPINGEAKPAEIGKPVTLQ